MIFKFLFVIAIVSLSFIMINTAYGQIGLGKPAVLGEVSVTIEDFDKLHVVQEVIASNSQSELKLMEGDVSNIKVLDLEGNEVEHAVAAGFGIPIVTIFPGSGDVFVTYDLNNVMFKKHGTTWTLPFLYLATTTFHLPESVDLAFVNLI